MFIVNGTTASKFDTLLKHHMLLVATSDVYYQNAKLLKGHHKLLDFSDYNKYYKNILNDIKLETEPIDAFLPFIPDEGDTVNMDEVYDELFIVNRVGPEYEKIDKRITWDDMRATIPPTHPAIIAIMEDGNKLQNAKDDLYISWSITKYLQTLDEIRLAILSNMTPAIEYVVDNIDEKTIRRHIHSSKINEVKYKKTIKELCFKPDVDFTRAFYEVDHDGLPSFDIELLLQKLCSNIDCKVDSTIVVAIYLTLTFAMTDIKNNNMDEKCAKYVRDVLSKI
jgi:hypothetical protein